MLSWPPAARAASTRPRAASSGSSAAEELAEDVVRHFAAEAVAAQQEHVARTQVGGELVDLDLRLGAERPAQDAALRVRRRLFPGERALAHHLADQRVVVAEQLEPAVAQAVGTAVADVGEARLLAVDDAPR